MNDHTTSAAKQYKERKENVQRMLGQLSVIVADHSRRFRDEQSRDWGFIGDLGYVEEQLQEAIAFLTNQE